MDRIVSSPPDPKMPGLRIIRLSREVDPTISERARLIAPVKFVVIAEVLDAIIRVVKLLRRCSSHCYLSTRGDSKTQNTQSNDKKARRHSSHMDQIATLPTVPWADI